MTQEPVDYINSKDELFKTWIDDKARLHIGIGAIKPLIKPFQEEFPAVNLNGNCQDCILDMLIWARSEARKHDDN